MDYKETILTVIRNNAWVTGARHTNLIMDLQQRYGIDRNISEDIIHECLSEDLIAVNNDRYSIRQSGVRYLQDIARDNYVRTAYGIANAQLVKKHKPNNPLEKWSWIAGIVGAIVAIVVAVYEIWIKK